MAIAAREPGPAGHPEPPNLKFEILAPGIPPRVLEMRQDIVRIGKLSSSHLQIQDAAVSRVHAVIEATAQGELFVIDLGSSNGTFVNGQKIAKERLRSGDEMTFGQTRVKVTILSEEAPTEAGPTTAVVPAPVAPAAMPEPTPAPAEAKAPAPAEATSQSPTGATPPSPATSTTPAPLAAALPAAAPDLFAAAAELIAAKPAKPPEPVTPAEPAKLAKPAEPVKPVSHTRVLSLSGTYSFR